MNDHSDLLKLEVIKTGRDGRRQYSTASKRQLVDACLQPGASVSGLALRYGVNANLLHKWIVQYGEKRDVGASRDKKAPAIIGGEVSAFIPVEIARSPSKPASAEVVTGGAVAPLMPSLREMRTASSAPPPASASRLTIAMPNGVKLELDCRGQDAGLLATLIETLGRCDVSDRR